MAMRGRIKVPFGEAFPFGLCTASEQVEPSRDFDKSNGSTFVQELDKDTGQPVWQVEVLDMDPEVRTADRAVVVRIVADVQPVLPDVIAGTPFRPIELENLTATPWVDSKGCRPNEPQCRARIKWSYRATGLRAPRGARAASSKENAA